MSTLLMATAAPIVTPDVASLGALLDPLPLESAGALASPGALTALPSATALASVSAALDKEKSPPDLTVIGPISVACETLVAMLMAIAAATETPPALVDALGVPAEPVPLPP